MEESQPKQKKQYVRPAVDRWQRYNKYKSNGRFGKKTMFKRRHKYALSQRGMISGYQTTRNMLKGHIRNAQFRFQDISKYVKEPERVRQSEDFVNVMRAAYDALGNKLMARAADFARYRKGVPLDSEIPLKLKLSDIQIAWKHMEEDAQN